MQPEELKEEKFFPHKTENVRPQLRLTVALFPIIQQIFSLTVYRNQMETIKNTRDFSYVYRRGISKADPCFVLYAAKKTKDGHRMGISVSKKVGNSVIRHRIKRRVKEIVRLHETAFPMGYEYIVIARKPAAEADYRQMEHSVLKLLGSLKLETK